MRNRKSSRRKIKRRIRQREKRRKIEGDGNEKGKDHFSSYTLKLPPTGFAGSTGM